jgi:hypothetical protein
MNINPYVVRCIHITVMCAISHLLFKVHLRVMCAYTVRIVRIPVICVMNHSVNRVV